MSGELKHLVAISKISIDDWKWRCWQKKCITWHNLQILGGEPYRICIREIITFRLWQFHFSMNRCPGFSFPFSNLFFQALHSFNYPNSSRSFLPLSNSAFISLIFLLHSFISTSILSIFSSISPNWYFSYNLWSTHFPFGLSLSPSAALCYSFLLIPSLPYLS